MSGSWVGRPSWITEGSAPERVPEVLDVSSVTVAHRCTRPGAGEIYRWVRPRTVGRCVDTGCARRANSAGLLHTSPVAERREPDDWRSHVELDRGWRDHPDSGPRPATGSGFKPGMVVQELGWDDDTDDELRVAIEDAIDADMVDGDYGNVVDAVLLWWRDDDGDLVDGLVDSLTDLVGGGAIWLLTPKVGRPGAVDPADIAEAAPIAGPRPDDHGRGQQGLDGHPAGRAQAPGLTRRGHHRGRQPLIQNVDARAARPVPAPRCSPRPASSARSRRSRWPGWSARRGQWGTGPAGGFAALALRWPDRAGLIDELGHADLRRAPPAQQRAGPRAARAGCRARATASR